MVGMSEIWQWMTPVAIWELRYGEWRAYSATYDDRAEQARKQLKQQEG
jgi:hypothetical protein